MKQIKALYKYILSFRKDDWEFEDYPLETWKNPNSELHELKYGASFTNWYLFVSHGESEELAIVNLKKQLQDNKANNIKIPRPGKKTQIQFSDTTEIDKYESIASDFFDKIIGISYYNCFISDYSSILEFDLEKEEVITKIKIEYSIEPNENLIFAEIFKQINEINA
ncbi:hypothetical protein [Flavobacterium sp.]|uniref:hypothetical protein n=1 Tax=Flavobacterium sp. TaxID=239 RepID=UPI003D150620